ncbi:MAG: sigma-70 family RNA polymerase sigma factor [Gemmataceae bacterium]
MTDHPDPTALMALARGGDADALGRLLAGYRGYLALLARLQTEGRLQAKVDASDVVQEACLEAYRDFPAFRGSTEKELLAWLRQVLSRNLSNLVRHYAGTQRRDVRLEVRLDGHADESSAALDAGLAAVGSSPSQQAVRREQAVLLAEALERLPEDQREAMVLRTLRGLSFPEVAARMGRSTDAVEKLWARGLIRLRREMGGRA